MAASIVKYAQHAYDITLKPEKVEDVTGFGLKGIFENNAYKIGKADFIGEETKHFIMVFLPHLKRKVKLSFILVMREAFLDLSL